MAITLTNATLVDPAAERVETGGIRIESEFIAEVGPSVRQCPGDEVLDCHGAVVLPGMVNGHTHLYSALAAGMPPPPRVPASFREILELVWWRLDRAHDAESIEVSGRIGALDALHAGTTTLIDHHASPSHISGSLDDLARGIDSVGLRSVLCYETTDRNGAGGAFEGLEENRRYLEKCALARDGAHAALVGAHAAFTMSDATLSACAKLADEYRSGVHIHVAEDPCDDQICRGRYGAALVDRLARSGITDAGGPVARESILAHCTHLSGADAQKLSSIVGAVAHNPRSNMNNQVGYAPVGSLCGVQLGTDGIGGDMFSESHAAWYKSRDARAGLSPRQIVDMLGQAARTAGRLLGRTLGVLNAGAAADVLITDYVPATPVAGDTIPAHLIFAMGSRHVRDVLIAGVWAMRGRVAILPNEAGVRRQAARTAQSLWNRMLALPS